MPRKATVSPEPENTAKMADFQPEIDPKQAVNDTDNAECENSVKSIKSAEKQKKTRRSTAKKADPGILDDTAQDEQPKKNRSYYRQRVPNEVVRKEAALAYIEKKMAPKTSNKANGHFPNSDEAIKTAPGDNSRFVLFGLAIYNMQPIDINNVDDVNRRINEYFELCAVHDMKPGVANLAMALGIERHRLLEVVNGAETRLSVPYEVSAVIKKAHAYMGSYWEQIMQNGKINPASGIFLGKNNFGYRDAVEHVVTPNIKTSDQMAPSDLQRRIEAIPDD